LIRKTDGGAIDAREIELIENIFRKDFTWQEETNLVAEIDRLYREKNIEWSGRKTAQIINKRYSIC
jgi:ParB-like chromosome segregation protein Spo0J